MLVLLNIRTQWAWPGYFGSRFEFKFPQGHGCQCEFITSNYPYPHFGNVQFRTRRHF